jgi:hypothetical protein
MDAEAEARLSEVAAYLASVPVAVMPDAVETRINAALAAEAATGSHPVGPPPSRARVRRRRADGGRRRADGQPRRAGGGRRGRDFLRHPLVATGSVFVCLMLVILGITLAARGGPTYSSAPDAGSAAGSSAASSSAFSGLTPAEAGPRATAAGSAAFSVTVSGTKYERATLAGQARARSASSASASSGSAGSASAGAAVGAAPSAALRGCVLHLTGGALPRLVDRATYQGEAAYVVVSSTRVWVVGLGCTAAKTELIVSVALAGLPGNLRALVSVEQ